jgi:predicted GNAT family N-acyltransferase
MGCRPPRVITLALSSTLGQSIFKHALIVRNIVFRDEEHLITQTDHDEYDELSSTKHIVVYVNSEPVAAARVIFPNTRVARAKGGLFGLPVEHQFDLSPLMRAGLIPAESGRVAVLKKYRKSEVILWLLAGIYWVSRNSGVNAWAAAANAEVDALRDTRLMARVALARGLQSPVRVSAHESPPPPGQPSAVFYKPEHWELARQGRFGELPLPNVLSLFSGRMGAKFMGDPLYLPEFARLAFPIVARLNEIPEETLEQFKSLRLHTHRTR